MKKWEKEIVQKQINDEQKVIYRLRDSYKIAMKDVEEKIQILQGRPQTQSVIYQLKYQQELQKQLENTFAKMSQEWYKDIDSYLKGCYEEGFFETMYSLHNQGIPIILPFNQEEMAQMAAQSDYEGIKLSQKLYDDAIETARISRQEMTRGIANNEDWATIANRISKRGGIAVYNATRIVRTESGRIHSEVRMKTMMKAKDEGADVVKQWDSTVDGRTRSTHIHLDGQLRELDQPFKSPSGATAMYPRGFGVAAEDINCRCELMQRARWALDKSEIDKCVGDLTNATEKQLQTWADKLGVSVDELIKASNGIIEPDGTINHSIKAKNYNDFKKKYKTKSEDLTAQYQAQLDVIQQEKKKFMDSWGWYDDAFAEKQINVWKETFGEDDPDVKNWTNWKSKQAELEAKLKGGTSKEAEKAAKAAAKTQSKLDEVMKEKESFMKQWGFGDESAMEKQAKQWKHLYGADDPDYLKWKDIKKKEAALQKKLSGGTPKAKTPASSGISGDAFSDARKKAAKNFSSGREADKYHRPILDKQWDNYSDREKYSIWEYTHNSNPMNKSLSGYHDSWSRYNFKGLGNTKWGYEDNWRTFDTDAFSKKFGTNGHVTYHRAITDLTKAIDKAEFLDDCYLVRGSDSGGMAGLMESILDFDKAKQLLDSGDINSLKQLLEGNVIKNHAFTSTGIAADAGFPGNVKYRIYAPKGTKGVYAEPQSYYGHTHLFEEKIYSVGDSFSEVGSEAEVILQRGTSFRVTKIDYRNGNYTVEMEIVDQPNYFKHGDEETFNNGATRHKD